MGKNSVIHKILEVGDTVVAGDPLLEYTNSFEDEDTVEMMAKLRSQLTQDQLDELLVETVNSKYSR